MAMAMAVSCASFSFAHHFETRRDGSPLRQQGCGVNADAAWIRSSASSSRGGLMPLRVGAAIRHGRRKRKDCGAFVVRCEENSSSSDDTTPEKIPFGYTRKDVIFIGVGLTAFGVGLKYGLEFFGVDSLRAGNVVQITMVAGLTIGWIASYVFRVSNKDMTYAKQLKDYENKVMEKRLEELPEAELESMLAQVEEDKIRLKQRREKMDSS